MRIVTWNLNGIRAAHRKGLDDFIDEIDSDIWLFQEVRALPEQMPDNWKPAVGHEVIWHPAKKKGYSGVSTWSRVEMSEEGRGISTEVDIGDSEGRVIHTKHGNLHCINIYLPNGSANIERQRFKDKWLEDLLVWADKFTDINEPVLLCGDLNIAHTENDIWNPKGNAKSSGFLPHEREWFSELLNEGWHDLFREYVGDDAKIFSWWSNRGQARVKDRGWRIDYLLGNQAAANRLKSVSIDRDGGLEVSDHAPVILELN